MQTAKFVVLKISEDKWEIVFEANNYKAIKDWISEQAVSPAVVYKAAVVELIPEVKK